ncbi:MAG: hypothetical protein J6C62_08180, partial [Clostridia bacterium]|nr:hypothetical protein [Clostridia bacterium]
LYYICHNFPERENKTLRSKISLRKQYNLPLGKYSCGVAIIPIATPLNSVGGYVYLLLCVFSFVFCD